MKSLFFLFFSLSLSWTAQAQLNGQLELQMRTIPRGINPLATVAYDQHLWGKRVGDESSEGKINPFYSYMRYGFKVGGSPTAAAFVQWAPLAPIIFEAQRGTTYRFLKQNYLECNVSECLGRIDRTTYSVKLAMAYEKWVFLPVFSYREIDPPAADRPVALDVEYFVVPASERQYYIEKSFIFGYRLDQEALVGLYLSDMKISFMNKTARSIYGIYKDEFQFHSTEFNRVSYIVGLGFYWSDEKNQDEFSVVAGIVKKFGESLSLF